MKASRSPGFGFALVEVLIAALLFGLGALALTRLNAALVRHAEAAQWRSEATLLAQSRLDELRIALAWLPAGAPWPPGIGALDGVAVTGSDAPRVTGIAFDRRWQVQALADAPALRRIDVRVGWIDRDGAVDPGIALTTLVAARAPDHAVRAAHREAAP